MENENKSSIIDFYNKVFLPRMKPYVISLNPRKKDSQAEYINS